MFGLPRPLPRPPDRRRACHTATVAERGECLRVALPPYDGPSNAHAGQARAIADHFRELHVHLLQRFFDPLQVPSGVLDEMRTMPLIGPSDTNRLFRSEGCCQQSKAMEPLHPLAIVHVRFGTVGCALHLARINQQHLEARALQKVIERDPVHASRNLAKKILEWEYGVEIERTRL